MAGRIAWGTDGQLYAAGESYDTSFSDYFTVVSLTASGTERWVYRYGEPGLAANMAMSVVVGHDGSVYVAGSIPDSAYMDFAVIGLTSAGGERWVYRLKGAAEGPGLAYSLAAGSDRNIYAAGMTFGGPYGTDFTVASLTSTGGERWVYRHARSVDSAEMASSVVWGGDGNLHAAGTCWNAGTGDDFAVISLTPSGTERWVRCYDGPAHGEDGASSIAYGADGYVYAAGSSTGIGTQSDITVAKMDASSGVAEVFGGARPAGHLGPTTVKSRLCLDRNEPAQLLDAVGRCAVQLRPGANDIRHLAPGVYFCRQQAGGETRTRKLVVQR
jgi:outer membrane protein assembly factor BamB